MTEINPLNLYMFMLDVFTQRDRDMDFFIMKNVEKSIVSAFGDILDSAYCKHIISIFHVWCDQEGIDIK